MMLLEPTLKVNRLIVFQGGHRAFDCSFHSGVNIIRGRNSSGKTTILDLLAYGLGAENIRWKPEALLCSKTMVEVELNGVSICLERDISLESQRPISIFWGGLKDALVSDRQSWETFPFKRSLNRLSFSQSIFDALGMPAAQGEGASNITMHQILRVLYADQPSVHSPIFRMDRFDTPLMRETIAAYLCGIYDDQLYSAQLRIREVNVALSNKYAELKNIFNVLGRSGQESNLSFIDEQVKNLELERDTLYASLEQLKAKRNEHPAGSGKRSDEADKLRLKLDASRKRESAIKDEIAETDLDLADSILFVQELRSRIDNINESESARSYFDQITFQFCPSCLAPINESRSDGNHCHLCLSELSDGRGQAQLLRMRNELNIQLKESVNLIDRRTENAERLRRELPLVLEEVKRLAREYEIVAASWSTEIESQLEHVARKLGSLDEEIRQNYERKKLAEVIGELQKARDALAVEAGQLRDTIELLEKRQDVRKGEVAGAIEASLIKLLKLDLPLQVEFVGAKSVEIDFISNTIYVNGSKNFSESSAVVLRHLFHLALLTASLNKPFMRVPRFMILDGIDDGGMEKERSHRLQKIIVEECSSYEHDYQLIFATSDIEPSLEKLDFVVGKSYSPELRSLDIKESFS
jgi:hypothetical protein